MRDLRDGALTHGVSPAGPAGGGRPRHVVIIGAGPAGLTAAHHLARVGVRVTIL